MFRIMPVPFGRSLVLAAAGDRVFVGDNDRYEIREYSGGKLVRIVRMAAPPRPVAEAMVAERRDAAIGQAGSDSVERRFAEALFAPAALAQSLPAYADFVADGARDLWVRAYPGLDTDSTRYDVFAADGTWRASVMMPPRFRALLVADDAVVGVWRDEDDVQQLRRYPLSRTAAPGR
jgi:hypothetical protein